MDEDTILGDDANFNPSAGQKFVEPAIAVAVQQGLDFRRGFVPPLLQRGLAGVLRDGHIGGIKLAVADDLNLGDRRDFFANQLEDRAAEVAGDSLVALGFLESHAQERVVEALAAGRETIDDVAHAGSNLIPVAGSLSVRKELGRCWLLRGGDCRAAWRDSRPALPPFRAGSCRRSSWEH